MYGAASFTTARGDAASMRDFAGIMGEISGVSPLCASPTGMTIAGNRESLHLGRSSRRSSAWVGSEGERAAGEEEEEGEDDDATDRRRSMSANGDADGDGEGGEGASMRDGSSSVGVWHGVFGKGEKGGKTDRLREN